MSNKESPGSDEVNIDKRERQWNRNKRETNNVVIFYYLEYLNAWKYFERTKAKKRQLIALRLDIFVRI